MRFRFEEISSLTELWDSSETVPFTFWDALMHRGTATFLFTSSAGHDLWKIMCDILVRWNCMNGYDGWFTYHCPFQHFPLSTCHYRAHFSGRGFWKVGTGRLICHTALVIAAAYISHARPFATAGTTLLCRWENVEKQETSKIKTLTEAVTAEPTWVQEPNRHWVLVPWWVGTLVPGRIGWLLGHWASSQSCGREDTYTHLCSD